MNRVRAPLIVSLLLALSLAAPACTPSTSTSQRLPIGSVCVTSGQCGTGAFYCDVAWPGGYCKEQCSSDSGCPGGSVCAGAGLIASGECVKSCNTVTDCRAGYLCSSDSSASHSYCAAPPISDGGAGD